MVGQHAQVDADRFRADLEAKPDVLGRLADRLDRDDLWAPVPPRTRRLVFLGMGSSHSASSVAAARLRSRGLDAVAELASSDLLPPPSAETVVVAVSASGDSRETVFAAQQYAGRCPVVLLTNAPRAPAGTVAADAVVPMLAGEETGGVACRSYLHTLALLLALEERLTGAGSALPARLRDAAEASADLLARRTDWLPDLSELLLGPDGTQMVAPARRLSSAQQAALMLREGPRRQAVASETGDWSHVDVYLTKTTDYRLLLFAGSRWEDELLRWTAERGSTVVAVGAELPQAAMSVRYAGDEVDDVRLLAEVLVAELLAQHAWAIQPG